MVYFRVVFETRFIQDHSEMYGLNVCEDVGCHSERKNEILLQTVMPFEIRKL